MKHGCKKRSYSPFMPVICKTSNTCMKAARSSPHAIIKPQYLKDRQYPVPDNAQDMLDNYQNWHTRHGRCDKGLHTLSPLLFKAKAYDDALAMLEKEGYTDEIAHKYAYHAAGLFRTTGRLLTYLEKWGSAGKQPLHDIIQDISLPQKGRFDSAAWSDAVLRHGPKMAKLVKFAAASPVPQQDTKGQWSYHNTLSHVAHSSYKNGADHPALATYCFQALYTEKEFNMAAKLAHKYNEHYADTNNRKPVHRIPDITIDGETFGKPDYVFSKLPDGDIRGLLLGHFTNCCQHIAGQGAECAAYGFLSPESGFYTISHKSSGNIIGQSWAWRSQTGALVLDSLESLSGHMDKKKWKTLCSAFAQAACADTKAEIKSVNIGTKGGTPKLSFPIADHAEKPLDYKGYRDSKTQYTVPLTPR